MLGSSLPLLLAEALRMAGRVVLPLIAFLGHFLVVSSRKSDSNSEGHLLLPQVTGKDNGLVRLDLVRLRSLFFVWTRITWCCFCFQHTSPLVALRPYI